MRAPAVVPLCLVALAACSAAPAPPPAAGPVPTARPAQEARPEAAEAGRFERSLRDRLRTPALPAFTIPTDVLTTDEHRRLAQRLELRPGLYQGIAVVDATCGGDGGVTSADRVVPGRSSRGAAGGAGHFDDGTTSVSVAADGTGVYDAPGLHVAVLPGGAGVYDDGRVRVSVQADGSGTYTDGDRRLAVGADGSGSYRDAQSRLWVASDGAGGYSDQRVRVSVSPDGSVDGDGDPELVAVAARVVREGLPRFAPVPPVVRPDVAGQRCGAVIRLDANVLFDFGSSAVSPSGAELVGRVAPLLRELGFPSLSVTGHTDSVGSAEDNQELSERRAGAVRDLLAAADVPESATRVVGAGESQPLRPEVTPEGRDEPAARRLNRRVELVLREQ